MWESSPRVISGVGSFARTLRELRGAVIVVTDARMKDSGSGREIAAATTASRVVEVHDFDPTSDGLADARKLADVIASADAVVAAGGGTVIDAVKLAALASRTPHVLNLIASRGKRAGLVPLSPPGTCRLPVRVAAPTTVGTSSEVSQAACLEIGGGRRLVLGHGLRPDIAVLDPALTSSLPDSLLREGILEALLRLLGPYIGTVDDDVATDAAAVATATELVSLGNRLVSGDRSDKLRIDAARLSSSTQVGCALLGRPPYSSKLWFLANELATVARVRKMSATAALLGPICRRIMSGDERLGSRRRLVDFCARVRIGHDPVSGIATLLSYWRIGQRVVLSEAEVAITVSCVVEHWGGRLPMLAALGEPDIKGIISEGAWSPPGSYRAPRLTAPTEQ